MKSIYSLKSDIYRLVGRRDGWFTPELATELGQEIALKMQANFGPRVNRKTLRLSKMGPICPKHLWHSVHTPELAIPLDAEAIIKFSYGHTIEAMTIALAKAADHSVVGEQDELDVLGIKGHRDCVIDGHIVDVKSCSGPMYQKMLTKSIAHDDSFGYLDQLDGYMVGSAKDDLVIHKDRAFILAVDKIYGRMCLYEHRLREEQILRRINNHKEIVGRSSPPACSCGTVADGESGNLKLNKQASYNAFKYVCRPELRTFLYADGYHYLTKVVREPNASVHEVDRNGNFLDRTTSRRESDMRAL